MIDTIRRESSEAGPDVRRNRRPTYRYLDAEPLREPRPISRRRRSNRHKPILVSITLHLALLLLLAFRLTPVNGNKFVIGMRLETAASDIVLMRIEKQDLPPLKVRQYSDPKVNVDVSALAIEVESPDSPYNSIFPEAVAWDMKISISPSIALNSQEPATADWQIGMHPEADQNAGAIRASRSTGYFGIPIKGRKVVFLADASSSMERVLGLVRTDDKLAEAWNLRLNAKERKLFMRDPRAMGYPSRWQRLTEELAAALESLDSSVQFSIVFFGSDYTALEGGLQIASSGNKRLAIYWVQNYRPVGSTDPQPALEHALSMRPDEVFFLTDGEFDPEIANRITSLNSIRKKEARIHAIGLGHPEMTAVLRRLAQRNAGEFVLVRR